MLLCSSLSSLAILIFLTPLSLSLSIYTHTHLLVQSFIFLFLFFLQYSLLERDIIVILYCVIFIFYSLSNFLMFFLFFLASEKIV